jgi:hypothetical protein
MSIQQDGSSSPAVLSASYCLLEAWRQSSGLPLNAHWSLSASNITVEYVCGNRFRLRNLHPVPVRLQWSVGSLPRRSIELASATVEGAGERTVDVGMGGDVLLFLDGSLVATRPNLGVSCP